MDHSSIKLILSSRTKKTLEAVASEIKQATTYILPLDLADSSEFEVKRDEVLGKFGQVDILINNGGISQRENALDSSEDVERQIMEINYFGNIALSKAILPSMVKKGSGQLVIMSSIAGKFGFFLRSSYSASKHALHGYYESLRLEEEKNNIKVSLVCPGKNKHPYSHQCIKR